MTKLNEAYHSTLEKKLTKKLSIIKEKPERGGASKNEDTKIVAKPIPHLASSESQALKPVAPGNQKLVKNFKARLSIVPSDLHSQKLKELAL
jgi:hypothetical protein